MKHFYITGGIAGVVSIAFLWGVYFFNNSITTSTPTPTPITISSSSDEDMRKELGIYTLKLMDVVDSPLSKTMRAIISRSVVDVSMDIFSTQEERKEFAVLISIESKFNPRARSHAGALGLTQVIPKYAKEFGAKCGLDDVSPEDLEYPTVNLVVGACRFKTLLELFNGQTAMALVAYNAGQYSDQLKQLQRLETIASTETASYVTKFIYVKQKVEVKDGRGDRLSGVEAEEDKGARGK